ncbi:hypothetical protein EDD18DRAFT_530322 [Armillaria luteobubalina]|uniref:Uncharacterized protein n=1 Tax=Armillaria luteobubalina TaxID=153913 RepID=A0AA39PXJ5_9AGAR|nr:hypothetical protein EDD18DRAFT_530322 [Armillaria luteobubalina]
MVSLQFPAHCSFDLPMLSYVSALCITNIYFNVCLPSQKVFTKPRAPNPLSTKNVLVSAPPTFCITIVALRGPSQRLERQITTSYSCIDVAHFRKALLLIIADCSYMSGSCPISLAAGLSSNLPGYLVWAYMRTCETASLAYPPQSTMPIPSIPE